MAQTYSGPCPFCKLSSFFNSVLAHLRADLSIFHYSSCHIMSCLVDMLQQKSLLFLCIQRPKLASFVINESFQSPKNAIIYAYCIMLSTSTMDGHLNEIYYGCWRALFKLSVTFIHGPNQMVEPHTWEVTDLEKLLMT